MGLGLRNDLGVILTAAPMPLMSAIKRKMALNSSWASLLGTIEFISCDILRVYLVSFLSHHSLPKNYC